ncbi:MAG: NAD(P)H-hydrate dehydratase [Candidatus Pacearchaeota archaeon]
MKIIKKNILKKFYKKKDLKVHKGMFGKLVVIGGSEKYSGSPNLNALGAIAALKSGVDTVEIIAPLRAANIIASYSPNLITIPLKGNNLEPKHLKTILKESNDKSAFVIGGGILQTKNSIKLIINFLKSINISGVIDAGAILPIKMYKTNLENFVFTPHAKEFERLASVKLSNNLNEKIKQIEKITKKYNTTILLKGYIDIISDGKKTAIVKGGTAYMTKAGTGDVLAGILGALIAQKPDKENIFDAACAASYINKKAGEMSKKKSSLLATDLIEKIGEVVDNF